MFRSHVTGVAPSVNPDFMVSDVTRVMHYSNNLNKVVSIVARIMAAQSKEGRAAAFKAPTAERLQLSRKLLFIVESQKAR